MPLRRLSVLAVVSMLWSLAPAASAEADFYRFDDLLRHPDLKDDLDSEVRLYFVGDALAAFAEHARPDVYSGHGVSISPFGGSPRHCVEAFDKALRAMVGDAKARGYHAITDIQVVEGDQPTPDATGFRCGAGYKWTGVTLAGTFAMTPAARQRMIDDQERSARLAERPPGPKIVRLAFEPFLVSPEARAAWGGRVTMHVGVSGPAYRERYGPGEYGESVIIGTLSAEAACRQAVMKTLASVADEATEKHYDTVLGLRSYQDDEYAPYSPNVDCRVGWRSASVKVQASLANAL